MTDKVLLTIHRDASLWVKARGDVRAAYLPFACREIIEGRVEEVTLPYTDWLKLQGYLRSLEGGADALPLAVSDSPPPAVPETSPRALAARKLGEIVVALGAISPYGGDIVREERGRYYGVPFARGRELHGMVMVYSVGYVRVAYTAATPNLPPNGLPVQDSRTFDTPEKAASFLSLVLHGARYAEALAIPLREKKRKT